MIAIVIISVLYFFGVINAAHLWKIRIVDDFYLVKVDYKKIIFEIWMLGLFLSLFSWVTVIAILSVYGDESSFG